MKSKLLTALIAAIGLGAVAAPAQAGVIASSYLGINNFLLLQSVNGQLQAPTGVSVINDNRNGQLTTTLNGVVVAPPAGSGSATTPLQMPMVQNGSGDNTGQDDTSTVLVQGLGNFAAADLYIAGSAIGLGANGMTRSDASVLGGTNSATSGATITNNILATLTFSLGSTETLGFSFDYVGRALADITSDLFGTDAAANSNSTFSILVQGTGGVNATIEQLSCQATAFAFAGANSFNNVCSGSALTDFLTLNAGTYIVQITQASSAHVQAVPEPSSIALAGLGLLGIGASLRRRKQA